tara:strand:+ start:1522 stop:2391 length:870 start_codon:yes stop_codon:yes gene_type:complete
MKKITFIINPIAGHKRHKEVERKIHKYLDNSKFDLKIKYSKKKGDLKTITKQAIANGSKIIIGVGGDGTVNEISSELINSNIKMGIIPTGSGNGLALSIGIPNNIKKAIEKINSQNIKKIDCISVNDLHSINLIGFGFDALVAKEFSKESSRGLIKYIYLTFKLLFKFKPKEFKIKLKNKVKKIKVFSLNICNGQQFGNNFIISPKAKLDDGNLRVCIIRNFNRYQFFYLLVLFFFNKIHLSKFFTSFKIKKITVEGESKNLIHVDGESQLLNKTIKIKIIPKSINFIV